LGFSVAAGVFSVAAGALSCVETGALEWSLPPPLLRSLDQDQPFQWLDQSFVCADAVDAAMVTMPIDKSTTLASEAMGFLSFKVDPSLLATVCALAIGAGRT
jgi:hypothetical protein